VAVYILGRLVPAVAAALSIVILARLLGRTQYGVFVLLSGGTYTVGQVASQWIQMSVLRFVPGRLDGAEAGDLDGALIAALSLLSAAIVISAAVLVLVSALIPDRFWGLGRYIPVFAALTVVTLVVSCLQVRFIAQRSPARLGLYAGANAISDLALPAFVVLLLGRTGVAAAWALVLSSLIWLGPMALDLRLHRTCRSMAGLIASGRAWLHLWVSYGTPLSGWFLNLQVLAYGGRYVLTVLRGPAEVGLYAAVYDLVNKGVHLVANAIELAVYPVVMRAADKHREAEMTAGVRWALRAYVLLMLPALVIGIAWERPLVALFFPREFQPGYQIIPFVAVGVAAWHLSIILQKFLEARRRTKAVFAISGVAAMAGVALNLALIPAYGYMGAAAACLLAYCILLVGVALPTRGQILDAVPWRTLRSVLVAALVMVAATLVAPAFRSGLSTSLVGTAGFMIIALAAYALTLICIGELRPGQILRLGLAHRPRALRSN
jgi:O-antigen/teichoic acid export membrane protein